MKLIISEKTTDSKIDNRLERLSKVLTKEQIDNLRKFIIEYKGIIQKNPDAIQSYSKVITAEQLKLNIIIKTAKSMNIIERLFCL